MNEHAAPHSNAQVYHVTVMPCYDKKLEASRQDFYNDMYSTRDVDCVITSGASLEGMCTCLVSVADHVAEPGEGEVQAMLGEQRVNLGEQHETLLDMICADGMPRPCEGVLLREIR